MNTPISASTDGTPPSAPGTLTASAVSANEIDLSWGAATDNVGVTGYQIFRCQNVGLHAATRSLRPPREPRRPTRIRASPRRPRTATRCGRSTQPGISGRSRTAQQRRRLLRRTRRPRRRPGRSPHTRSAPVRSISAGAPRPTTSASPATRSSAAREPRAAASRRSARRGGGTTTYSDTGLSAATSYSYEVRALDAAGNTGPFSNTVSATTSPSNSSGLVAAYGFNEGTGTTVTDASGNGNGGTVSNTTWAAAGKYGGALSFNGTNARVDIPNSASLQLTTGMTLEAWVNPTTTSGAWRDVIYKGVRQLLPRRDLRASAAVRRAAAPSAAQTQTHSRRRRSPPVRGAISRSRTTARRSVST